MPLSLILVRHCRISFSFFCKVDWFLHTGRGAKAPHLQENGKAKLCLREGWSAWQRRDRRGSSPTDTRNRFCGAREILPSLEARCSIKLSTPSRVVAFTKSCTQAVSAVATAVAFAECRSIRQGSERSPRKDQPGVERRGHCPENFTNAV